MTIQEFRKAIAESPNVELYQNLKIDLNYPHLNFQRSIVGLENIYEFVTRQIEGFSNLDNMPEELNSVKKTFERLQNAIIELYNSNNKYENNWKDNFEIIKRNNPLIFLYDSPETEFLIKVHQEKRENFYGAYEYFSGNTSRATTKDNFIGYVMAYEFSSKGFSAISERKTIEEKSLASIKIDFQKNLEEANSQLVEYLKQTKEKAEESSGAIARLRMEKEAEFYEWYNSTVALNKKFNDDSTKRMKEFEDLYQEKLKLKAPAKYWSDRATKLKESGNNWLKALITSVAIGIVLLTIVLVLLTNGELDKIFAKTATAIKWSVVFVTLISFIAFIIRIFSKLTFSSFHLVRDAEEREQLTYVYLALQQEKGIDQTERHLIMQSLFSRADSGLLKDDSGPTMPGNIVEKIIQK